MTAQGLKLLFRAADEGLGVTLRLYDEESAQRHHRHTGRYRNRRYHSGQHGFQTPAPGKLSRLDFSGQPQKSLDAGVLVGRASERYGQLP